jgi:hypothetical protein
MNQNQLVLNHMIRHGYITPLVANNYGVTRLASRIHDLRLMGWNVVAKMHRDDRGKRYTRYSVSPRAFAMAA